MKLDNLTRMLPRRWRERPPVVTVLRLHGVIAPGGSPLRPSLNIAALNDAIERAFKPRRLKAVALAVNSPGGAPAQSALIHDRIRLLAEKKKVPVLAFCEDVAASGGYWIACAGDEIFAERTSIVGSIGVISASFGFQELLAKAGIERRLHTAGERKSFLDPFQPEQEDDVRRLKALQKDLHATFKAHVKARRGERLKGTDKRLFSGEFWTGQQALDLGLIDGLGGLHATVRERYGEKVRLLPVGGRRNWLQRRMGLDSGAVGAGLAEALVGAVEERAAWNRYGL